LVRVLSDPSATVIVVEYRARLAPFGVEQLREVLAAQGRRIVVDGETTDDLARDMIERPHLDVGAPVRPARGAQSRCADGDGCQTGIANGRGGVRRVGAV
jgi:hypothetical protein